MKLDGFVLVQRHKHPATIRFIQENRKDIIIAYSSDFVVIARYTGKPIMGE